ncbi:MAG: hypothetical protein JNL01_05385 [Bdellovibrionales bacterium]|nr:hypothetical protein [Bdellovibrionales bacterium]
MEKLPKLAELGSQASRRIRSAVSIIGLAWIAHTASTQWQLKRSSLQIEGILPIAEAWLQASGRPFIVDAIRSEALALDGPWEARSEVRDLGKIQFWWKPSRSTAGSMVAWVVPGKVKVFATEAQGGAALRSKGSYEDWRRLGESWQGLAELGVRLTQERAGKQPSAGIPGSKKKAVTDPFQVRF